MTARGRFFVLDGLDGCGKSTQATRLARALGAEALHLREPGSTAAGERIRALLLDPEPALTPAAQALLFAAARRQMLEELVAPALASGRDVVCERFHPSTFAYQGWALGVGEERVLSLLETWAGTPAPDLTLILDLDPESARARRGTQDRFESAARDFHERVAEGYRRYAARVARVVLLDARDKVDDVAQRIAAEVARAGR
ncbi:MAG: dTMP kinase [Planctomycetes bacterium]|nr:dTMP kinase [Planctomycetota bacterium]